mgnify:FL=1
MCYKTNEEGGLPGIDLVLIDGVTEGKVACLFSELCCFDPFLGWHGQLHEDYFVELLGP